MNANQELGRRLADFYATEAPQRAPARVLESVLAASELTKQRRAVIRLPWRFPIMNSYARMAIAAVAVIAIGAVGLAVLRPGPSSSVGGPAPSASPSPSPLLSLTQTFTSDINGFSVSYPAGWHSRVAKEPWTDSVPPNFESSSADVMYEPVLNDHFFLNVASQSLAGATGEEWANEVSTLTGWDDPCTPTLEPITIDGADGAFLSSCASPLTRATAWAGDRGYLIWAYGFDDQYGSDNVAAFREVLATVQLDPGSAVDAAP